MNDLLRESLLAPTLDPHLSYSWFGQGEVVEVRWVDGILQTPRANFLLEYDLGETHERRTLALLYLTPCCDVLPSGADPAIRNGVVCSSCKKAYSTLTRSWGFTCGERFSSASDPTGLPALEHWLTLMGYNVLESSFYAQYIHELLQSIVAAPAPWGLPPITTSTLDQACQKAIQSASNVWDGAVA